MALPLAGTASAIHDVPSQADVLHVDLVPNFRQTQTASQCTATSRLPSSHGPPLAFQSCNPPAFLPGTVAHAGLQSSSDVDVTVVAGDTDPSNGDQADVLLAGMGTDLHSGSRTGPDYDPNPTGADVTSVAKIRISDHFNTTTGQPCATTGSCPGTVIDTDFPTPVSCVTTADPSVGSTCSVSTSADQVVPGVVLENKKAVVQAFRIRIKDAGNNGAPGDTDDRDAFMQGIYIP